MEFFSFLLFNLETQKNAICCTLLAVLQLSELFELEVSYWSISTIIDHVGCD